MTPVMVLRLKLISQPIDACTKRELKFAVELEGQDCGELYLRLAIGDALAYAVGDVFAGKFVKLK